MDPTPEYENTTPTRSTRRRRWGRLVCTICAVAVLSACDLLVPAPPTTVPPDQRTPNATVVYVVDGDTIIVMIDGIEENVRLIGLDTPEIAHPERNQTADCFGDEASDYLGELLPVGTEVHLQRDVEGRDDYGRILGYVYRSSDGIFVNYEIVRHGFATPLSIYPNDTYQDLFADAANEAHDEDLGLWSAC